MKLHLPVKLFRTVLTCMAAVSFVTFTSASSTCYAATAEEEEENELLMLLSEPEYPNGSIIYTTRQTSALTLTGYESILFKDISYTSNGGAIYNSGTFELSGNGDVTFCDNASSGGSAIYNYGSNATFTLSGNGTVTFSGNRTTSSSGAIYNTGSNATFSLSDNKVLVFSDNQNGAICNEGTFTLSGNGTVTFSGNRTTYACDGAIYNEGTFTLSDNKVLVFSDNQNNAIWNRGTFTLSDNVDVSFSENTGQSIASYGNFTLNDNGNVTFSSNKFFNEGVAIDGGTIHHSGGTFTISGNNNVTFCDNTAYTKTVFSTMIASTLGGAIYNGGDFMLSGNGNITFSCNTVSNGSDSMWDYTMSSGGAIYNYGRNATFTLSDNGDVTFIGNKATATEVSSYGGAISNIDIFKLCGNGDVAFRGNTVSTSYNLAYACGGAIYNVGTFTLSGNGDVLFEKNAEVYEGSYCLCSIYSGKRTVGELIRPMPTLNLSALEGKSILFRDSIYAEGTVNLNQDYTDSEGVVHKSSGDIILTGATTEADLREVKGGVDGTADEILNSRTSEIPTMTNLYGGRLIVEDKAILKGHGITAAADSSAMVRVKDGELNHSGYALTFNNSTTLEAEGVNAVTAKSVDMKAGSTLSFVVGEANLTTAALTLTGTLTTETISVAIDGPDDLAAGTYTYALMQVSTYDTSAWTADKISVATSGISFDDLSWHDGTLYLNYVAGPTPSTLTWSNASGDGLWNTSSLNWSQGGNNYSYSNGTDVNFGNDGAGTITLEGNLAPTSVTVNNGSGADYIFAGTGKLTGSMSLTKQGAGKLTINTSNDYTGGTTISGGTLVAGNATALGTGTVALNGGTLVIAANGFGNDLTATGNSTLKVDNGYTLVLGKVIANSGTLTLSGTFDASALTLRTNAKTYIDVKGNSGKNGFAKDAAYAVTIATGTTVNAGATITHGSHTLTLGTDGIATAGGTIDYGTYFLHNGATVAVSAMRAIPEAAAATVDMDGGTLNADADVSVTAKGGRIDVSHGAVVAGSITNTQIAIHGCEISADIKGNSSVSVDGEAILSGTNTYTGNTNVLNGGVLKVTGSVTSDIYLQGGMLNTDTGMTLVSGQDIFFRGGQVKGNVATVSGSGLNLNQNSTLDGSLTLGGGTLTLSNGAVLTVSGSLTLDSPTQLVGNWAAGHEYTLLSTGGIVDNSGSNSLNDFFGVDESVGTVKVEGNDVVLSTVMEAVENTVTPTLDAADYAVVNSLWGSMAAVRDFARVTEQQHLIGMPGQTIVWASVFGSFTHVTDAHGFTSNGGGYAAGVQHAFTENLRSGVALGQSFGTVKSRGPEHVKDDQTGMLAAVTLQYEQQQAGKNSALFNGYAAVGRVNNDADGVVTEKWNDTVLSIGGRASYAFACGESSWVIPFVGLEWSRAEQGTLSRADGARYSDGEMSLLTLPVGVTLRSGITLSDGEVLAPELTLAYEANLAKDVPQNRRSMGMYRCTVEGYDPGKQNFMLNAAFNVLFNEHWSAGASYTLRTAEHSVNHSTNISVRYMF